jgi:hypothetical protein
MMLLCNDDESELRRRSLQTFFLPNLSETG